jgi:hypothetical protein
MPLGNEGYQREFPEHLNTFWNTKIQERYP